ncbi:hypothetical protein CGCF415_v005805 [Colletotrichum fructicola]|uniref:Uncharacterized protein n=1 Tax=Colletotrichum fructicola (strain Nara gc5) TaxID=1213859 RepID=A0A7J6IVT3_COLFN|nr:hypothetical protein CFRS1_v014912 [Colletotrichum fructicola]KAF4481213.1 hypothetical protein CGGC5_v010547 [Colletotrichum fructicola Nara gc5]KAF4881406.1 hypothetical protein CGCFRS4_v015591 [Colletotrichum fructicola]KAF4909707.1 hypothetical protein CGCF415_v005805 [Colletotrichum fructicola]KAF4922305.1 hypothetical protein CGCF245_v015377 [Colletotrichum fructicola]
MPFSLTGSCLWNQDATDFGSRFKERGYEERVRDELMPLVLSGHGTREQLDQQSIQPDGLAYSASWEKRLILRRHTSACILSLLAIIGHVGDAYKAEQTFFNL